jgi:transposase
VVTAVEIHDKNTGDSPILPSLTETTAKTFNIHEMSADKAYCTVANFDAVTTHGGILYAAFKKDATGECGGIFEKMFHLFCLNREDYLKHYHKRSNVESTFSAVKRKFGEAVRSKTDTAQKNEVLCKFVCQNLCCLIHAIYELGLTPHFWGQTEEPEQTILKFPGVA